jgi:hypothetical protein
MLNHPELTMALFHDRHVELIAEAERHRLLAAARRWRRRGADAGKSAQARGAPDGTLAACEPRVAAPAR